MPPQSLPDKLHDKLHFPRWIWLVFGVLSLGMVPWIVSLSANLPDRQVAHHWALAWVGFDLSLFASLLVTAYLAFKANGWIVFSSVVACTLLTVDIWFDILTSRPGTQLHQAIILAIVVELPLAILCLWLAASSLRQLIDH